MDLYVVFTRVDEWIKMKLKWINREINKNGFIILLDNNKKSGIARVGSGSEKRSGATS